MERRARSFTIGGGVVALSVGVGAFAMARGGDDGDQADVVVVSDVVSVGAQELDVTLEVGEADSGSGRERWRLCVDGDLAQGKACATIDGRGEVGARLEDIDGHGVVLVVSAADRRVRIDDATVLRDRRFSGYVVVLETAPPCAMIPVVGSRMKTTLTRDMTEGDAAVTEDHPDAPDSRCVTLR